MLGVLGIRRIHLPGTAALVRTALGRGVLVETHFDGSIEGIRRGWLSHIIIGLGRNHYGRCSNGRGTNWRSIRASCIGSIALIDGYSWGIRILAKGTSL